MGNKLQTCDIETRVSCISLLDKDNWSEEEMKIIFISHRRGSEESYKKKNKSVKEVGLKGMSDEGIKKEIIELGA